MGWLSNLFGGNEEEEFIPIILNEEDSMTFLNWLVDPTNREEALQMFTPEPEPAKPWWALW